MEYPGIGLMGSRLAGYLIGPGFKTVKQEAPILIGQGCFFPDALILAVQGYPDALSRFLEKSRTQP